VDKVVAPELEDGVLDEFNEGDEQTPGVRTVDDESLEEHASYLLLYRLSIRLRKQIEQRAVEVVRVTVWVAQLVSDGIQEQVATCGK